jgi:hypothetical protein
VVVNGNRPELLDWDITRHAQSTSVPAAQPLPFAVQECRQVELARAELLGRALGRAYRVRSTKWSGRSRAAPASLSATSGHRCWFQARHKLISCNLHGPRAGQARDEIWADQFGRCIGAAGYVIGEQILHNCQGPLHGQKPLAVLILAVRLSPRVFADSPHTYVG